MAPMVSAGLPRTTSRSAAIPGAIAPHSLLRVHEARGVVGGGGNRLKRREAGLDEQFQLAVDAFALEDAGVGCVGARDEQHTGVAQPLHIGHGGHEAFLDGGHKPDLRVRQGSSGVLT